MNPTRERAIDLPMPPEPTIWPFQKLVNRATKDCGCVDSCRCCEGIEPRLVKNTIYHTIRKIERWPTAGPARVEFKRRLISQDVPKRKADDLSWRLLEDMLFWSEGESGFDLAVVDAELDAMLAFGEERKYPESPTDEQIAEALNERDIVFARNSYEYRRPTTVMHICKRLGLWELAQKILEYLDPERGELEDHCDGAAWHYLCVILSFPTLAEIRDEFSRAVRRYDSRRGGGRQVGQ